MGEAKTMFQALKLCAKKSACNGFQWTGTKFEIYQARQMVAPAPGYIAFVVSGMAIKKSGYLWAMKPHSRFVITLLHFCVSEI